MFEVSLLNSPTYPINGRNEKKLPANGNILVSTKQPHRTTARPQHYSSSPAKHFIDCDNAASLMLTNRPAMPRPAIDSVCIARDLSS